MKINEFMEIIEPISLDNLSIIWNLYHNFENPPEETKLEGKFNIEFLPAVSKTFNENASGITGLKNPFPDIKFESLDQNFTVIIPSYRLLTVSLEEEKVVFTFMPHGIMPIQGFPIEKHISWGKCTIDSDYEDKSIILKNFIQILFINQEIPRPRCESCKGMKMFWENQSDSNSDLFDHQLICSDCLRRAISFFDELNNQIEEYEKDKQSGPSREILFKLIDGGIDLANRLNSEKLNSEFLFFQAKLMSKDKDSQIIKDTIDLLDEIIMFSSSWNYNKLKEKSEKLRSEILENNPSIVSPAEEILVEK
ncbi:MAG: hypothetical protein ACTSVK_14455, partial [Promethearchaeota archaeon]